MIVQPADTVIFISRTWMISRSPCRNVCATVSIMKKSSKKGDGGHACTKGHDNVKA